MLDVTSKSKLIAGGFEVRPAMNGGWVVMSRSGMAVEPRFIGAFTNPQDLVEFVAENLTKLNAGKSDG